MIHLARVLIASLFVLGGINKAVNYDATLVTMAAVGIPLVELLLPLTMLLELSGGVIVAIGARYHVHAAFALAAFTVATNFLFHDFWNMIGAERAIETSLFFKNIVVVGGLIHVAAVGSLNIGFSSTGAPS